MRNILGLILVAIVFIFSACEMDEVTVENTGSITVSTITGNNNSSNLKSTPIDNTGVPVYVKGVNVTVTAMASNYSVYKEFTYQAGGASDMMIEAVALGGNNISATSVPVDNYLPHTFIESHDYEATLFGILHAEASTYQSFNDWYAGLEVTMLGHSWARLFRDYNITPGAVSDLISYIIANERNQDNGAPIYAIYNGTATANVVHETPAMVTVNMTTNYGRQMVTFTVEDVNMLDLYDIEIIGNCPASPQEDANGIDGYVQLDENTHFAVSYWSNPAALDGNFTDYVIKIREKNSTTVLRTEELTVTIAAGISMWTNVVITNNAFYTDEQALAFTYDELDEENEDVIID